MLHIMDKICSYTIDFYAICCPNCINKVQSWKIVPYCFLGVPVGVTVGVAVGVASFAIGFVGVFIVAVTCYKKRNKTKKYKKKKVKFIKHCPLKNCTIT